MDPVVVAIQRDKGFEDLSLPEKQSAGASGFDLFAAVDEPVTIRPGEIKLVSTGFRISIPTGIEAQVRPRSGLALKYGIGVLNSPGTIDADYRGTVGVILFNFGKSPYVIRRGDRIAQMVFCRVASVRFEETSVLDSSERGEGGFGSTDSAGSEKS